VRLACPSCGAVASLEAWALDDDARATVAAIVGLPGGIQARALRYLGLFRRPESKRGMNWVRAKSLAIEQAALVGAKEIAWDDRRPLVNRLGWWEQALDVVLERADNDKLRRPLENHNYLRCIAYDLAAKAGEAELKQREAYLAHPAARPATSVIENELPSPELKAQKIRAFRDMFAARDMKQPETQ
jgi:hypothetical protein